MNATTLNGTLQSDGLTHGVVRIAGLDASGAVCAETIADPTGQWRLSAPAPIASVIAQLTQDGIAACRWDATDAARLRLPSLYPCRIEFASQPPGARLWVDPISLEGFPDAYLPALRSHPEGTIDLHLGDYPCEPANLVLHLQSGRYRVGGGRLALRPATAAASGALRISSIEDLSSGRPLASTDGEFLLVAGSPALRVSFAEATP